MSAPEQVEWSGWGRWILFAVSALLVILSVPLVVANSAAAGWNIFLGLLLFGAVASGNKHAPTVAFVLAAIFALRAILGIAAGAGLLGFGIETIFSASTAAAAYQLRRQRASA